MGIFEMSAQSFQAWWEKTRVVMYPGMLRFPGSEYKFCQLITIRLAPNKNEPSLVQIEVGLM